MATLSGITAVIPLADAIIKSVTLGATVPAFSCVYPDSTDGNKYKATSALADASSSANAFLITGGAHTALAWMCTDGALELVGVTNLVAGRVYIIGETAGTIVNDGDLASGSYLTLAGYARSTSVMQFGFMQTGIDLA